MSHCTALVPLRPAAQARQQLLAQPELFVRHLPAEQVHQTCRDQSHGFRQRIFSPAVILWTFLTQLLDPDHSCRAAVARLLAWRSAWGLAPCSTNTGAYCKARARLPEGVLAQLTRTTGRALEDQADRQWLWKGRHVKVVDGSGLSMPDTPDNQREYPQPTQIAAGLGFPLLRLVVVFSLAVGTVLDAALGRFHGKRTGEVSLFRTLDVLEPGDVLLADRLYANFWDVARLWTQGIDVVMRMHAGRTKVWFRGRGHSRGNRRVWWHKPQRPEWMTEEDYAAVPEWLRLRAVRVDVRQRGFRTKRLVLVTTLTDAESYTAEDLAELYRRRWQAELNLRSLKETMQMDILRGQTPEMVRKEVWGHLLAYNLVRAVLGEAAAARGVRPDQLSFAGALQHVNAFLPHLRTARTAEEWCRLWRALIQAVGEHEVGDRPDRYEPRAVKRRPKNYPKLKEPRAAARRRLWEGTKRSGKKR
jgi:Transposase DDE domain